MLSVIIAVGENYILCKFDIVSYDSLGMIIFCCRLLLLAQAAALQWVANQMINWHCFLLFCSRPCFFSVIFTGISLVFQNKFNSVSKKFPILSFFIVFHSPQMTGSELG